MGLAGGDDKKENKGGEDPGPISSDMLQAMIRYMPLRTVASFSGGALTYDQLTAIVEQINNA